MKKALPFLLLIVSFLNAFSQIPEFAWAKSLATPGVYDKATSIVADESGNVYYAGNFSDTIDFDPGSDVFNLMSDDEYSDCFITKLDASGNFIWAKKIGGIYFDYIYSMALDETGNLYIAGNFQDTVDFDPSTGVFELSSYQTSGFILKLDAAGDFVFVKDIAAAIPSPSAATATVQDCAITVDSDGNIYTTGTFWGSVDLDPGTAILTGNADEGVANNRLCYVQKLDPAGNLEWAKIIKHTGNIASYCGGKSIKVDGNGNVFVAGEFSKTFDFDPGNALQNLTSRQNDAFKADIFVLKLDASGNYVWVKQLGGDGIDTSSPLDIDDAGNLYISGVFTGDADFAPGETPYIVQPTYGPLASDLFIAKYNSAGNFVWADQFSAGSIAGLSADNSGNLTISGSYAFTVDFNPDPTQGDSLTSIFSSDIYVLKLDNSGNYIWAFSFGGNTGADLSRSSYLDNSGNFYCTGKYAQTVDFDPGADEFNLASNDFVSTYILKLIPAPLAIEEGKKSELFSIHPNPAEDFFIIDLAGLTKSEPATVSLFDATGRIILNEKVVISSGFWSTSISLDGFAKGVYTIRLETKALAWTKQIVK